MKKPMLQIALDNLTIESAIEDVKKCAEFIDVLEVGTILISSEGKESIRKIKEAFPNKIIVADGKIADAGKIFGKMFFDNGADYTTAICAAEIPTIKELMEVGKQYGSNKEVQIELTKRFVWKWVDEWKKIGVPQVVWHRSRDSEKHGEKWSNEDLESIKKLANLGFKLTITGGIVKEDIKLFKGLPIYIFIAGRSIRDAKNPLQAAKELKDEINKHW